VWCSSLRPRDGHCARRAFIRTEGRNLLVVAVTKSRFFPAGRNDKERNPKNRAAQSLIENFSSSSSSDFRHAQFCNAFFS
jgi:hypothetical protein